MNKKKNRSRIMDYVPGILMGMLLAALLAFCFDRAKIESGSMEPTFMTGSTKIFVNSIFVRDIERNMIVEFSHDGRIFCKRVIGNAGDEVRVSDGKVYVNGNLLDEPYASGITLPGKDSVYIVPEGCIFVMGDNRENSNDSRYWEDPYVKLDDVRGVYLGSLCEKAGYAIMLKSG